MRSGRENEKKGRSDVRSGGRRGGEGFHWHDAIKKIGTGRVLLWMRIEVEHLFLSAGVGVMALIAYRRTVADQGHTRTLL